MRIALVSLADARDVRSWSGTLHFSKAALQRHVGDVVDLTPAPVPALPLKALDAASRALRGQKYLWEHEPLLVRRLGKIFTQRVRDARVDAIFAPAASSILPYLETDVPIIYFSDATFRAAQETHRGFQRLTPRTEAAADAHERASIAKARYSFFASQWALDSARRDYGADPARSGLLHLGANLSEPPSAEEAQPRQLPRVDSAARAADAPSDATLRLLFVGVNWEGKGGPIALDALRELRTRGVNAQLTIVGCEPPAGTPRDGLTVIPFLDKSNATDRARFAQLWRDAHLFILPTRFEAAGIVFIEAAAYGLPSLGTDIGGVPSYVQHDVTGQLLQLDADGHAWADAIQSLVADPARYARYARAARARYERELNWDAFGQRLSALLADIR